MQRMIGPDVVKKIDFNTTVLVDVRPQTLYSFGSIPGAINIPATEMQRLYELPRDKTIYVFCQKGEISGEITEILLDAGYDASELKCGYLGYLSWFLAESGKKEEEAFCRQVEKSLQKKFRGEIWSRFTRAIRDYELVKPGDKIAVCISGGKDSMLMAKLFQMLQRHSRIPFDLVYLVMDPGYSEVNMGIIQKNAEHLDIPITVFKTDIFDSVYHVEKSPCYLCARMRRGHLYSKACELGCNKIALGHHYDDVIETILMGMLYGGQVQTMMPKLHSTHFPGMELIRPLYLVREESILAWRDENELTFIQCACHFTDTCTTCGDGGRSSARREVKEWIRRMKETNPFVESNIFHSMENVSLNTVISYKKDGIKHHFLEAYDEKHSD